MNVKNGSITIWKFRNIIVYIICTSGDPFLHVSADCRKIFAKLFLLFL